MPLWAWRDNAFSSTLTSFSEIVVAWKKRDVLTIDASILTSFSEIVVAWKKRDVLTIDASILTSFSEINEYRMGS